VSEWRPTSLASKVLAALVATSVLTLVAAAIALTSPLQARLRQEELTELGASATAARTSVTILGDEALHAGAHDLDARIRSVARHADARIVVIGPGGRVLADTDADARGDIADAMSALGTGREFREAVDRNGATEARVALPFSVDGRRYAIALRRTFHGARAAAVVRDALPLAALAGLITALVLGLLLSSRLVRRLRSLRDAALLTAEVGPGAEVAADPAKDEVGDLSRAFSTMQSRLRDQEEARRTFVSTASHELRTPLASLHLMLDLLDEELAERGEDERGPRDQLARAGLQVRRLEALAADLLDLSRLDAGIELRREPVDLREVGAAVVAEFNAARNGDGVVALSGAAQPCWALSDPGAVAQVARTLIDNALRFAPEGTRVDVGVAAANGGSTLSVSDHGPGVPAEEAEAIFERFRRGSRPGNDMGFGLGLPIGRELARRMGGDVELEQRLGLTTFRLTVPGARPPG
jgi:signal transduction histidine kinase